MTQQLASLQEGMQERDAQLERERKVRIPIVTVLISQKHADELAAQSKKASESSAVSSFSLIRCNIPRRRRR